jgi:hypothetical protein
MDRELGKQVELAMHALRLAQSRIDRTRQLLQKQHSRFGLGYDRTHDALAQVISTALYRKRVAQRRVGTEAQTGSDGHDCADGG